MLVDAERTLALRCSACGRRVTSAFSLFRATRDVRVDCECGCPVASLQREGRVLIMTWACVVCETAHDVRVRLAELKSVKPLYCRSSHTAIGYVGEASSVLEVISRQDTLENLVLDPEYADYFDNPHVMYDALASFQAMAEVDRLDCACGSDDIEVVVGPGAIRLHCSACGGSDEWRAADDEDLASIRRLRRLTLTDAGSHGVARGSHDG